MELTKLTIEQIAETSESLAEQFSRHGINEVGYDGESIQFLNDGDAAKYWAGEFGEHVYEYWLRCGRPNLESFAEIMNAIESVIDQVSPELPSIELDFDFLSNTESMSISTRTPSYMAWEIGFSPSVDTIASETGFSADTEVANDKSSGWYAILHVADELRESDYGDDGTPLSTTIEGYFVGAMLVAETVEELFEDVTVEVGEENIAKFHFFGGASERELLHSIAALNDN